MIKLGLVGKDISYSKSKELHEIIGRLFGINLDYQIYDIDTDTIGKCFNNLDGFNVTKPYKEYIYGLGYQMTTVAKNTKAINTVFKKNGQIWLDNTDYQGFKYLIKYYKIDLKDKKIAILGTGGAAKTVYRVVSNHSKYVKFVSRNKQDQLTINYKDVKNEEFDIFINATPVGTYPNNQSPLEEKTVRNKIVIDLVYNPLETKMMSYAKESYNGLVMLVVQALYAQKRFSDIKDIKINKTTVDSIIKELLINV
ncbi:MAG: hypothetical protein RBQ97_00980 [Acholeplasma sp.]|nr:hypothetical protein [Acholeplasma sp.]